MVLLENDAFLVELTRLFDKSRLSGSVVLTIKRFSSVPTTIASFVPGTIGKIQVGSRVETEPTSGSGAPSSAASLNDRNVSFSSVNGHNKPVPREGRPPLPTPSEFLCLIRATLRTKKISTVVHSKDVNKFQQAYWNLLKSNINGLKKLKKVKSAKPKIH